MKKEIFHHIEIPANVEATIEGNVVKIKGPKGDLSREFNISSLELRKEGNKIVIGNKKATKKEKKNMNSIKAHLKNMIEGVLNGFEYHLKVCYSHFPMTVEVHGQEITIKNYLGENTARKCKIVKGAAVKVEKDYITVTAIDREVAGQTAANLEKATKVRNRDKRIFQDGIFMTSKPGREI